MDCDVRFCTVFTGTSPKYPFHRPQLSRWVWVFTVVAAVVFLDCEKEKTRTIRIGVYNNPPKIEMENAGPPRGIFIDIIEEIANLEGWRLDYIFGTWDACLQRLEKDSIDLMPDVAFSDSRSRRFDFNQLTVLCSWLQVFSKNGLALESMSDLEGKTVAVLEGSIQQAVGEDIRRRLGLSFTLVPLPDYDACISRVTSGKADAVIVSRFYGYRLEKEKTLNPTSILLLPTTLHFASRKGNNADLLSTIDRHLAEMMNRPQSTYYRSLACWLHEKPRVFVPRAVLWSVVTVSLALIFFCVLSLVFRWQVRRRTKELAEKNRELLNALQDLQTARDEAIKRERLHAIGQLACGVAHDFNNLLVPIVGCADMMLNDPKEFENRKSVRHNLEVIINAAHYGTELVQRMQQFYRSVAPQEAKERVDINAVIREVIELTGARLRKAQPGGEPVEVVTAFGDDCEIIGRKSQLYEMLLNLVLNAADAMPLGGRLEVSTINSGGMVTVRVVDNGSGMTEEIREQCLQPFFTSKGEKGTGIGLTMVNNIVIEHYGTITIESAPGVGTRFILSFPAASGRHA